MEHKRQWLTSERQEVGQGFPLDSAVAVRPKATPELIRQGVRIAIECGVDGLPQALKGAWPLQFPSLAADLLTMFEWKSDYSVQIGSIDAQHQTLFHIARELHAAMVAGQGKTALGKILDRLVQYTAMHFAHEERLMRLHDYPAMAEHKAEHDALTKQVLQFQADFQSGRATMTVQLMHFLRDWLDKHIKGSDKQYAPHMIGKLVA